MTCQVGWKYVEMTTVAMEGTWKAHFRRMVLTVNFVFSVKYVYVTVNKFDVWFDRAS